MRLQQTILNGAITALTFLLPPGFAVADQTSQDVVTAVPPLIIQETGNIKLPVEFTKAAWIDVMSGAHLLPEATDRLRSALTSQGFTFATSEAEATASVVISGHVQLYNPARTFDSGNVFLGEIIEARVHSSDKSRKHVSSRRPLDYDAGVAHQGGRLLAQGGVPGGALAGAAFAILTDWLVDTTGLRESIADGIESAVRDKRDVTPYKFKRRVLFCGEACKQTIHQSQVTVSVWQGTTQLSSYSITLSRELPDMDEGSVRPLIDAALGRALEKLLEATRP